MYLGTEGFWPSFRGAAILRPVTLFARCFGFGTKASSLRWRNKPLLGEYRASSGKPRGG
jgi:hypothetical protein